LEEQKEKVLLEEQQRLLKEQMEAEQAELARSKYYGGS
jgi:hypothetical protein